eukprot:Blabericola_migrator_1__6959@NODE_3526_length_1708_cov_3_563681_g2191_i0_p2_GENE_NODE_3526_length_1708_cov_3_563681_g2191_i0NODE_3526_length_1708_cov_3_563681_g2191_i0_p2_ORF_typecomplete_len125_score5_77_NODE_3526_length_1708_cov_3_563681_g2191_i07291103
MLQGLSKMNNSMCMSFQSTMHSLIPSCNTIFRQSATIMYVSSLHIAPTLLAESTLYPTVFIRAVSRSLQQQSSLEPHLAQSNRRDLVEMPFLHVFASLSCLLERCIHPFTGIYSLFTHHGEVLF